MHTPKKKKHKYDVGLPVKYNNIPKKSPEIHGMITRDDNKRIRVPEDMALSKQDKTTLKKKKGVKGISKAKKKK